MSDDHAYQANLCLDDRLIQTPNIDDLLNKVPIFKFVVTNLFARPQEHYFNGKHNHINGKIDNRSPFDTKQITFSPAISKCRISNSNVWETSFWE
ncbi:hypothetical protein Ct9H90mP29_20820 [bacterium]|nr:MAG: hypothetical protein Ct9H90mP29_20820 [bacterium]